jgi:RNA methyltransferase, TrmH family
VATRPVLTSSQNPRFRAALALRDAGQRRARRLTLVDGPREISRALAAGARVVEAWVAPAPPAGDAGTEELVVALRASGADIVEAAPGLVGRLAYGDRSVGPVAVVEPPARRPDDLRLPSEPLVVILEGVEKPGNLGAIARSADGAGADALVVADATTDPWHPNAVRASLGTVFSLPIATAGTPDVQDWLRRLGLRVVLARVDAALPYHAADLVGGVALVLGSEARGLSVAWDEPGADGGPRALAVRIPMLGAADSLNVSTAAAVLLYEARRQRDAAAGRAVRRAPARRPG